MISWIVASHDPAILAANFGQAIPDLGAAGDQVIVVRDARSIAEAYNQGAAAAGHPVRCYVHHDVRVLSVAGLRAGLLDACTPDVGIVGVIGSTSRALPWWEGARCGSVRDARLGLLDFGPGGHPAAYLDGLLLATAQELTWDTSYEGWHLYDHDICQQQLAADRPNWCLPGGQHLVEHHTAGPASTEALTGWDAGVTRFHEKWAHSPATGRDPMTAPPDAGAAHTEADVTAPPGLMAGLTMEATAAAQPPDRTLTPQEREHLGLPPEEGS